MPADRLPPGLCERLLSLALDREIGALDLKQFAATTEAPTETERPRLLARYPFQVEILDKLRAERERHGRHKNLVVAATGTGRS